MPMLSTNDAGCSSYAILDHIPLGMFILQQDYTVLFWNTCLEEWSHIERQYILHQPIDRFFPKLALNKYHSRLMELFAGGPPIIFSCQLHHHIIPCPLDDHQIRMQHTIVTALPTAEPKHFHALFSIQDMTEIQEQIVAFRTMRDHALAEVENRKKTQQALHIALAEADVARRAKDLFLSNISHELRTPLNIIIGYGELLQEQAQETKTPPHPDDLNKILIAGKQLRELINNLLDIVKIESGKIDLSLEPFSLQELVQEVTTVLLPLAKKQGNSLTVTGTTNLPLMHSDPLKVRQILLNVGANACKFTENGCIVLDLQQQFIDQKPWIVMTITDSGIGIHPAEVKQLFHTFSQASSLAKNRYGGTGLGLALSQQLCELLGGNIQVNSQLGQGSCFTIQLPLNLGIN